MSLGLPPRSALVVIVCVSLNSACGGGNNSSSRSQALACAQKAGSDTDSDCVGHAGKPRKLDCDPSQTQSALNAGCELTGPGASDVCCPLSVRGTPESTGSTTVNCQQKADADNNPDCAGHPGLTRKLDCDATETQNAVNAGCEPTSAGESDVCCPTSVSGFP
jgi:hypothetical protein